MNFVLHPDGHPTFSASLLSIILLGREAPGRRPSKYPLIAGVIAADLARSSDLIF